MRHLSEWNADIKTVREWLIAHVENGMHSLEQMVSYERELQADQQVMCGNLVRSLHALERHPWRQTFIAISEVEQRLLQDATGDYERMDMESRDVLRQRVVRVAQQLRVPETLVAETAVRLAKREWDLVNDTQTDIPRSACLAFYLLHPEGLRALRGAIREQTRPRPLPRWVFRRHPLASYLTGLALLFAAGLIAVGTVVGRSGVASPWAWVAVLLAIAIPVSEWAVTVAHSWIEHRCRPTPLLRYDFSEELPDDAKTLVVVPVLWSSIAEVDEVMETLRVHYLANRQRNIHFAVLSDFPDAPTAEHPEDAELVEHAVAVVNDLRREYGADTFFLFHRARRHNAADNVYMGWERKRGKLVELAEYLAGKRETSFETVVGEESVLPQIRYILTVDADTKLPIGVVGRLAGTIHLPYNRPRLNASGTRVVAGYGVIQPRVGASYASVQASRFAALWAGQPGVDPYAFAVSNPYQDWFDQAVFVGKGIFDVAVFRRVLADRIPDNQVLSHDVLEGGFLRAGLASDIEVVEAHPETIYAYQRRQHRWVRGDWQLLRWLGRVCPNRAGERQLNDLCGIARWHIVDHCRRSLLHPALFVVSALGAGWLPGSPAAWEGLVLLTLFLPALRAAVLSVGGRQRGRDVVVATAQCLVQALVLPFTAVLQVDAVARSLYRMGVSHRRLLEWVPSAHTDREANGGRVFVYEPAGYAAALAWVAAAFASGTQTGRASAVLALGLWLAARPVARWLGRPRRHPKRPWLQQAEPNLRGLAEKIWAYYNHYVTEADLWLPPDNVQYHPRETVAHRTSPTNIGLYLACVVAAWDLGMIDAADMLDRLERTLKTVASLEKWHGHLYNWYDTQTGRPLPPRYVSTVDSGNLVTCLMVVHEALRGCGERYPQWAIRVTALRETVDQLVTATDFRPLYNADERLLSLGHHVDAERKDDILYDLLASEARQASFVAIALGQVPVTHWFTLARTMTRVARWKTLLSWSGTMFEYLMPSLVMRTYPGTIWAETYEGVIHRQRAFAERNGVPFGISESGYYAFDYQHNYQYRAFGVPGLGLDRGLEQQLVTAPYAALLALPFAGEVALEALRKYERLGAMGPYGYYEAVDFTKRRLPPGSRHEVVKSFMAHHQGMGLLAIANLLCDESIIRRFHAHPNVRAAELLLQERAPTRVSWTVQTAHRDAKPPAFDAHRHTGTRTFHAPTPLPEVNVLSNGRITSVLTQDGTGMLLWNGASVTRWREDAAMDRSGIAVYIHNPLTDETWSPARYPCASADTDWNVQFRLDKTCYETLQNGVESRYEVAVSPTWTPRCGD
ncbi:hypothetical protein GCM10025857_11800 [Alicyclobacillus contaminans]|nr:hypothetical protein GCM10025857_11800 [Alicyclobacillus contaminans]